MLPTIGPVPTFGFFMMLSFAGAWWAFRSEYKRKEAAGLIYPFPDPGPIPGGRLALFLASFIIGAKTTYWWINRSYYIGTLPDFLFSFRGNLSGGIITGLATACFFWRRQAPKPIQKKILIHPYQLMDRLLLSCGIAGFAGAILFAKIEGVSGLNYYGALIAGALTYFYINRKYGIPLAVAADIGSPGMMLAYGIGRIGCHLAGDGDWGIVNKTPQPAWLQWAPAWTWGFRFPHNSIHEGIYLPGCTDNYCTQLPAPVYPTSFYEAVVCLLFFAALWTLRGKIKKTGLIFAIFALLNGLERFTIEFIRVNPRYPIGSWKLSQAQIIAVGWIIVGLIALPFSLRKRPGIGAAVSGLALFFAVLPTVFLLSATGSQVFANFSQAHWRWRKDDGPQSHATWHAPQDFPSTLPFTAGMPVRLRIEVYNSLGNNERGTVSLQYQRGSAGTWTTVSNSTGNDFVMSGSSPYITDGQPTTALIRDDGAGTFAGGRVLVSTWQFTDTLNAGTKKEYEWCIKPTPSLSKDSLYQFRMLFTGSQDAISYGSPIPDMMYRLNGTIPGNAGIYKDPLVTGFFDRDSGWIASDGAFSIPLSDGRDFWAMNDSYIDHLDTVAGTTPCLFQVRNAGLVQPLNNWTWTSTSTCIGSGPGIPSLFKNNSDDNYLLWPTGGYQQGDTVYVYCSNIKNDSGGLGFTSGGSDFLAKMAMPGLAVAGFDHLQNTPGITFGVGFDTNEPGNYIYTWGVKGAFITSNIVVARFPRNNPRAHWSFWNGSAWDTAVSHIANITTGASNGVYCAKVRNKYVLLSTEFSVSCDAGTRIYVATSDSITGPFTNRKVLYTIPDNVLGHSPFFYAPAIHPEYINSNNELLITYDVNGYSNCEPACINNGYDPDYYRPRGLRVPLSLIDSGISNTGMPPAGSSIF